MSLKSNTVTLVDHQKNMQSLLTHLLKNSGIHHFSHLLIKFGHLWWIYVFTHVATWKRKKIRNWRSEIAFNFSNLSVLSKMMSKPSTNLKINAVVLHFLKLLISNPLHYNWLSLYPHFKKMYKMTKNAFWLLTRRCKKKLKGVSTTKPEMLAVSIPWTVNKKKIKRSTFK